MNMGERIKKLRRTLDLTQQVFGSKIGTTQNNIASYETGRREPSSAAFNNICKTFNVNEGWLRTGEGDMFSATPETALDELAKEFNLTELEQRIISRYLHLSESDRLVIRNWIQGAFDGTAGISETTSAVPPQIALSIPEGSDPEIEAELARIRKQRILERDSGTSWGSTPANTG